MRRYCKKGCAYPTEKAAAQAIDSWVGHSSTRKERAKDFRPIENPFGWMIINATTNRFVSCIKPQRQVLQRV